MRSVRVLIMAALTGAAAIGVAGCADAVANEAGVRVEVSPTSIQAGSAVGIRASCGGNLNPATVSSPVFGSVTIQPVNGVLSTAVQVPPTAAAGTSKVTLVCSTGSRATRTLTVLATTAARPTLGPHTGGGFLATKDNGLTSGSIVWLALGLAAFAAAAAVGVRSRRTSVRRRARRAAINVRLDGQTHAGADAAGPRRR